MDRKYYEAYEDRYKQIHALGIQWFDNTSSPIVLETVRKYAIDQANPILELGCGEGRDAGLLLNLGYSLIATDISQEAIDYCRNKFPRFADKFQVLDCVTENMGQKYKFIYAVALIHMLVQDSDRRAFYRFIHNHLCEDGISLICTMGDGKQERSTDVNHAFDLQFRFHEQSGLQVQVASTSCRMVTADTFHHEIESASLAVIEKGITAVAPDFPCMMYAVVKRV